jgi:N-acetylglucosaminyldiphosphoundecaprenol N-acetyl-beta-D-mannosaminyltransferase
MTAGSAHIAKVPVFGIGVSVTDYAGARAAIMDAARDNRSYAVSALATHGLTEAVRDAELGHLVNSIDLVTPDGQPVRWAMNMLHGTALSERVYGPDLVAAVCAAAAREGMSIYLFGSTAETCRAVAEELPRRYPGLRIAGVQPDRFRDATPPEDADDVQRIRESGADIVLVGRGCPRQERWVAEHRGLVPAPMLAVGAAFDYIAGNFPRPPRFMQRAGLEWLFRLSQEPRRLLRRYLVHNTLFCLLLARAVLQKRSALPEDAAGPSALGRLNRRWRA